MNDYENTAHGQKQGSLLPWVIVTVVVVFAGVGVIAMKTQSDQAVAAVVKMKVDVTESRKRAETLDEKRQDLEKQLADAVSAKQQLETDKADLTKQVADLNAQLELAKAGPPAPAARRGKKIQVVSLKGKHRR